jgi:hypothetical protein
MARANAVNCESLMRLCFEAVVMLEQKQLIYAVIASSFLFTLGLRSLERIGTRKCSYS